MQQQRDVSKINFAHILFSNSRIEREALDTSDLLTSVVY
jgi:hypothetical protein